MSALTPGPWIAYKNYAWDKLADVRSVGGDSIAFCHTLNEHDARLIAAAPELLESLQWILRRFDDGKFIDGHCIVDARRAIAKATGKATE